MATEPEDLTLRLLRRMDAKLDALADVVREIRTRVGNQEQQTSVLAQQYASISNRIDAVEVRLERIERRLDLVDAI